MEVRIKRLDQITTLTKLTLILKKNKMNLSLVALLTQEQ